MYGLNFSNVEDCGHNTVNESAFTTPPLTTTIIQYYARKCL